MEYQDIYIEQYDWNVRVYYNFTNRKTADILQYLYDNNYDEYIIDSMYSRLSTSSYNFGATVINNAYKDAVVIISKATCPQEFFNTLIHELNHLSDFIASYYHISHTGETISYLIGDIGMLLFPKAGKYLCN